MPTVKSKPEKSGKYRGAYITRFKKQKWITGTRSKTEPYRIACKLEDKERAIQLGYLEAPEPEQINGKRKFAEVLTEYVEWGKIQGGRGGRPWSPVHTRQVLSRLHYWGDSIPLTILEDFAGIQGLVEKQLRSLKVEGSSGKPLCAKTLNEFSGALKAFCQWCTDRSYLKQNPLEHLRRLHGKKTKIRRALTLDECRSLIQSIPFERRLLYLLALTTGLRINEIRNLSVDDVDWDNCELLLREEWTKNRKNGRQPLPKAIVPLLRKYCSSGIALRTYKETHKKYRGKNGYPKNPLLYVPSQGWRDLKKDLTAIGIPIITDEGEVDFHALRVTFTTLILDCGANPKEAQDLCRHAGTSLTMKVYARSRPERLHEIVEELSIKLFEPKADKAHSKHFANNQPMAITHNPMAPKEIEQNSSHSLGLSDSLRPLQISEASILPLSGV
jgi:integrase/recombinase XerD